MTDNDQQRASDAVLLAMDVARALGATAADAGASIDAGLSVGVRKGEVETLEYHQGQNFSVTIYHGQRKGSASSTDLSADGIRETVAAAVSIARYTSEDPCSGLAPADRMATYLPDLDLYHPWDLRADGAIELARECEAAALTADRRITNSDGASVNTFGVASAYSNTHGFLGSRKGTRHSVSCTLIASNEKGMQRDYWYTSARIPALLDSAESVGRTAAERTVRRLGARKLSTRKAPVLFSADLSRGLLGHLTSAISGGALYRKSTFLLNDLENQIFPEFVTVSEDPYVVQGMASTAYDGEGVQTVKRDLVSGGVLRDWILSQYSATKLGLSTTGNAGGVHNLSVTTSDKDLASLLREMGTGLYVTELMGRSLNMVTGDYSRGAAGFWVENGEIQYPVEEVTVAGNLRDMFSGLVAIGNDIDPRSSVLTGSWLISNMTIAGS